MIVVRRIKIGEADLFKQIRLTALLESPSAFDSTYESAMQRSSRSWQEQADSTAQGSDRATFIAFSGDSPVGITALYRTGSRTDVGEMLQVWVAPEYREQGVASQVMEVVFQWAKENGFRTVIATVANGNTRALRFYLKHGFQLANGSTLDGPDDPDFIIEIDME